MATMNAPCVLDAARFAYGVGLCVVPVREDGSKAPIGAWKDYQQERPTPEQMRRFALDTCDGFGLVCGAVSGGLEVTEFDDRATFARYLAVAEATGLGSLVARLQAGYEEETPGDGIHWLYRCPEIAGNTPLARRVLEDGTRKPLIETRGEGGFIVVAPSGGKVHPSGRSYRLCSGNFATIPTITPEERAQLHTLARSFDQAPRVEESGQPRRVAAAPAADRPGDLFNATATWEDILTGWTLVYRRDGVGYWRRPGKREGISATTNYGGFDYFYVFTTSTQFDPDRGYTRFAVYAQMEHGGDYKAAARALRAEGYGGQEFRFATATLGGEQVVVATPEAEVDDKDRAIAELRQLVIEARRSERRVREEWSVTLKWLSKEEVGAADRIAFAKLAATYANQATADEGEGLDEDGYALIRLGETKRANAARLTKERGAEASAEAEAWGLAGRTGLDRKTVSRLLDRFGPPTEENPDAWGLIGLKRETGGKTAGGRPISDVKVRMAAHRFADILVEHVDFAPETPRNHGGKREPCPNCRSLRRRTRVTCADCGLEFSDKITKPAPEDNTVADVSERADEPASIPPTPVEELAATYPTADEDEPADDWDPHFCNHVDHRGRQCTARIDPALGKRFCWQHRQGPVESPPVPHGAAAFTLGGVRYGPPRAEAPPLDPAIAESMARQYDGQTIAARLSGFQARWDGGERTEDLLLLMAEWQQIAEARRALDAAGQAVR